MNPRAIAFVSVGIAGFLVQSVTLAILTLGAHQPVAIATAIGVEASLLTNFCWHEHWTWRDRVDAKTRWRRLVRFHVTNGVTSLVGNTALTVVFANWWRLNPLAGNAIAVGLLSAINFVAADRWVFVRRSAGVAAILAIGSSSPARAAELTPGAVAAWDKYIAATEAIAAPARARRAVERASGTDDRRRRCHHSRMARLDSRPRRDGQSADRRSAQSGREAGRRGRVSTARAAWRLGANLSQARALSDRDCHLRLRTRCPVRSPVADACHEPQRRDAHR
jgi:putative flippase GtrA